MTLRQVPQIVAIASGGNFPQFLFMQN